MENEAKEAKKKVEEMRKKLDGFTKGEEKKKKEN